jgi:hypothetical protein
MIKANASHVGWSHPTQLKKKKKSSLENSNFAPFFLKPMECHGTGNQ